MKDVNSHEFWTPGPSTLNEVQAEDIPATVSEKIEISMGRLMTPSTAAVVGPDVNGMLSVTYDNILQGPTTVRIHVNEWFAKWDEYFINHADGRLSDKDLIAFKHIPFIRNSMVPQSAAADTSSSSKVSQVKCGSPLVLPTSSDLSESSTNSGSCSGESISSEGSDSRRSVEHIKTVDNMEMPDVASNPSSASSQIHSDVRNSSADNEKTLDHMNSSEIPAALSPTYSADDLASANKVNGTHGCAAVSPLPNKSPEDMETNVENGFSRVEHGEITPDNTSSSHQRAALVDDRPSSPSCLPRTTTSPDDCLDTVYIESVEPTSAEGPTDSTSNQALLTAPIGEKPPVESRIPPIRIRKPANGSDFHFVLLGDSLSLEPRQEKAVEQSKGNKQTSSFDEKPVNNCEGGGSSPGPSTSKKERPADDNTNVLPTAAQSTTTSDSSRTSCGIASSLADDQVFKRPYLPMSRKRKGGDSLVESKHVKAERKSAVQTSSDSYAALFVNYTPIDRDCLTIDGREDNDSRSDAIRYVFTSWRTMYQNLRVIRSGEDEYPDYIRFPHDIVLEDDYARHILSNQFVSISKSSKMPDVKYNWKLFRKGEIVWGKWTKNEYWPASVFDFTASQPLQVRVQWINDTTTSSLSYDQVHSFDLGFHLRFNPKKCEPKYTKAVCKAILIKGYVGYWEEFLTRQMYRIMIGDQDMVALVAHLPPSLISVLKGENKPEYSPLLRNRSDFALNLAVISKPAKKRRKKNVPAASTDRDSMIKLALAAEQQLEAVQVKRFLFKVKKTPHPRDNFSGPSRTIINRFHFDVEGCSVRGPLFSGQNGNSAVLDSQTNSSDLPPGWHMNAAECALLSSDGHEQPPRVKTVQIPDPPSEIEAALREQRALVDTASASEGAASRPLIYFYTKRFLRTVSFKKTS